MNELGLHLDEDTEAAALVRALRNRGVDLTTSAEAGLTQATDHEQLTWAAARNRAVLTYNAADFVRLHREFIEAALTHAGIIIAAQQKVTIGERMRKVLRLCASLGTDATQNRIKFLNNC